MARQLVFTSAPQGLTPGRTGYCTVARHRDLRDRLASALESLSVYPEDWQPAPVVCAFRQVEVGGLRFPVLSRIVHAGQDYTHRGNFLAHHLALDPEEIAGAPPPAEIFRRWNGWRNRWDGPPRWFDENDRVDLAALRVATPPALPAETWGRLTGDAGRAALLVEGLNPLSRVLRCPVEFENDLLGLLSESSALLPPAECWRVEFTTCLQPTETASAFRWAVVRADSPSEVTLARVGGVMDLTQPAALPPAPENAASRRARGTTAPPPAPAKPAPPPTLGPLGKTSSREKIRLTAGAAASRMPAVPTAKPTRSKAWVFGSLGVLLLGGAVLAIALWPHPPNATAPSATPPSVLISVPPPSGPSSPPAANPPTGSENNSGMANEEALTEITQLAGNGQALAALAKWQELSGSAPDYAAAHQDVLDKRVLPNARKEWLAAVGQILADLGSGHAVRADLAQRLAALRDFPKTWPVTKPEELEGMANNAAAILAFLDKLPDAPVWMTGSLTPGNSGSDYQEGTVTLAIPELAQLLGAKAGQFQVAAARATSLQLPAADQWFAFNILPADFDSGNYLILHDASRGAAGGRFMQLLADRPGQCKLTWRMFQPNSEFFQRYPANAPLQPLSRALWLRFTGKAPLPSLYLLLQRPGAVTAENWKPLPVPFAWLNQQGLPARVSLPSWLAKNVVLHAPAGQSFRLEPANLNAAAQSVTVALDPAETAGEAAYEAQRLVNQLQDKYRLLQTDAARAQQQLDAMVAITDPNKTPPQVMIDQAGQSVKKLQASLSQLQSAALAAGRAKWAASAAPWVLYCNPDTNAPMVFLQFTPNETGPTP
ncbi:MAG TPA: hypothetical protein VHC95_03720 [Opitutales bacterium]|nr:hypothetical protein [Opitutales bacterium]